MKFKLFLFVIGILFVLLAGFVYYAVNSIRGNSTPVTDKPVVDTSFTSPLNSYTLIIPSDYTFEHQGEFSTLFLPKKQEMGAGPTNFFYISIIPNYQPAEEGTIYNHSPAFTQKLLKTKQDESVQLSEIPGQNEYYMYKRIEDAMIGGYGAKVFANAKPWEFPAGTTEYRYYVEMQPALYMIGAYVGSSLTKQDADAFFSTLKLTPDTIAVPTITMSSQQSWKTFKDTQTNISFSYPPDWETFPESQMFENGDVMAVGITGNMQRPQSELSDGARFSVMKPITTSETISEWVKKKYANANELNPDQKPQFTQVTAGTNTFEKVYVCGLGCFSYYHTKINNTLYGFVTIAAGPNEKTYESIFLKILESVKVE